MYHTTVQSQLQTNVYLLILTSALYHKSQKKTQRAICTVLIQSAGSCHCRSLNVPVQQARGWGFIKLQRMYVGGEMRTFSMTVLMTSVQA